MRHFDVIIVGGGIMGCSTALHLMRAAPGIKVALVERGLCGTQASGVNFGNVRTNGRPTSQIPLSLRSRDIWWRIEDLIGNNGEYKQTGALKVAFHENHLAEIEGHVKDARDGFGLKTELLGRKRLREFFPWISEDALGARYSHDDGVANPRLVAAAFGGAAKRAGVHVHEHFEVSFAGKNGEHFGVESSEGRTIVAPLLANCAGAWGGLFARWFGEAAPIEAKGPQMGVTEPLPYFIVPSTSTVNSPIYLRQVERGNIVFGGGPRARVDLEAVRHFSLPENLARQTTLLAKLAPALKAARVIRGWSGIEGYLPDGQPVLGPSRTTRGLVHAFGFCGSGFQLGPGVGAVVAELLLQGKTKTPIAAFEIGRFTAVTGHTSKAEGNA